MRISDSMNYIKITYNIFVVKNQNGFNNALYDYMRVDDNFNAKQYIRSMVTCFPKSYPAAVVFHKEYETYRIFVDILNKDEMSAMLEGFEKFDAKIKDNDINTKPETNQKTKCEYCLTVFEYNSFELEEKEDRDMSGYHYYYYTKCPNCGNRILVKAII